MFGGIQLHPMLDLQWADINHWTRFLQTFNGIVLQQMESSNGRVRSELVYWVNTTNGSMRRRMKRAVSAAAFDVRQDDNCEINHNPYQSWAYQCLGTSGIVLLPLSSLPFSDFASGISISNCSSCVAVASRKTGRSETAGVIIISDDGSAIHRNVLCVM